MVYVLIIPRNVALTTPRISQIYSIGIERMASQVTIDTSWLDPLLRSGHSNGSDDAAAAEENRREGGEAKTREGIKRRQENPK